MHEEKTLSTLARKWTSFFVGLSAKTKEADSGIKKEKAFSTGKKTVWFTTGVLPFLQNYDFKNIYI